MAGPVEYNFTVDDASPVLIYSPYSDFKSASGRGDGLHDGWQTWYTGSGYLSSSEGPSPVGESFHLTSLSGASVSLSFYGTGVVLYGISNSSYDVTFDGSLMPNSTLVQGVFFSTSNEAPGVHNVSLTVRPDSDDQILSFNRVLITSVANSTVTSPNFLTIDNQDTSAITYTGDWIPSKSVPDIPSSASPAPFHSTTASGASASFNFTGRAVALYGSSTTNHGPYSVTLDGMQQVLNGSSQWLLGNMLMFYRDGLDENSTHSLNLTNLSDGDALSLNSVQVTRFSNVDADSTNTDITHGSSKVGAIVGPVIAFVVVMGVLGLYIWTKRREKHTPKKLERRSSIASSIFLPQRFRRKYNKHGDVATPYVLNLRAQSHMSTSGSLATFDADVRRNERARDEKNEHLTMPMNIGEDLFTAIQRQSRTPVPATYLPSELGDSRNGAFRLSDSPQAPVNMPRSSRRPVARNVENVSPVGSDDPLLLEHILEMVSRRIDGQRASAPNRVNARPPSVDDELPPYAENV